MSVSNGQIANATTFNNAFLSKLDTSAANTTVGIIGLNNTSDVNSGNQIFNTQRLINEIRDTVGIASEGDVNRKVYTSNNVVTDGDDLNVAVGKIDAKFDQTTGHAHDNTPGSGGPVSAADLTDFNNFIADWQTFSVTGAAGTTDDVSTQLTGETPGGGVSAEGVITSAPYNKVELREATTDTYIEDAGGQRVYGRITEAAGVWTLSYYTNEAGVETAHTLSSQDIKVYYLKVFTMANRPTIPVDAGFIASLDLTADIVDASLTQRGAVSTGAQSFAGLKTLDDGVKINDELTTPQTTQASGGTITALTYKPLIVITGVSTTVLQGIASGGDGKRILIHNDSTGDLTVEHDSAGASASDRIFLPEATDLTILSQQSVEFFYDSGDSRWKQQSGSGSGTGSGSGGDLFKNYISNGNASSTTGWSTYADAAGSEPVNGTGGSPNVTFTVNTSSPIDGTKDFKLSKDAANRQGEGVSYDFTTGSVFSNSRFKLSFAYDGSANFVAGENSDVRIFLYDVTNSVLIRPVRKELFVGAGTYESVWDTTSSTSYRLIFHVATTNASAWDLQFKFVVTGPGKIFTGPNLEDFKLDTAVSFDGVGTPTDVDVFSRRVGDSWEVYGKYIAGTPTATAMTINLPSGLLLDLNKLTADTLSQRVGYIERQNASGSFPSTSAGPYPLFFDGTTDNQLFVSTTASSALFSKANGNGVVAAGDLVTFKFTVPIKGWSANTSVARSGIISMSAILANGTRVTGTPPTALGEYRSYLRNANAATYTETNGSPAVAPSIADGIKLYAGNAYTSADTNNEPTRYEIFVGLYKANPKITFYQSTGMTGEIDAKMFSGGSGSNDYGYLTHYDKTTGILSICALRIFGGTTNHFSGVDSAQNNIVDCYIEIEVSDNDYQIQTNTQIDEVWLTNGNGHGSTNTKIRRMSNIQSQRGDAITYTDSATDGAEFLINKTDFYTVIYQDGSSAQGDFYGLSVNSTALTTTISSESFPVKLMQTPTFVNNVQYGVPLVVRKLFNQGDIIRMHTDGAPNSTSDSSQFRIIRG